MTLRSKSLTKPQKVGSVSCFRCGGRGIYHIWGTCFRCGGNGVDPTEKDWVFPADWTDEQVTEFHTKREAKNAAARARRHEREAAKAEAQLQKNLDNHPALAGILERVHANDWGYDEFINDVVSKVRHFDLTANQVEAVVTAIERRDNRVQAEAERVANTPPVEAGTYEITGEIVHFKWVENQWGGSQKMMVALDNGQKLWGTLPSSISEAERGDRVSFTATVEPSKDDTTFGFYSRPRKAQVLGQGN